MPDFGIFRGFNEKLFGDKLVAGQLPTQLGLIGSEDATGFIGLLDTYPNAAAAYSLRKLRIAYTGDAIEVRIDTTGQPTYDIGFVDGELDTATLEGYCTGGLDAYVTTWYDQSGNGYDATQSTAANQPQIVSSGSVILEGANPTVQFATINDENFFFHLYNESISVNQPFTTFISAYRSSTADRQQVLSEYQFSSSTSWRPVIHVGAGRLMQSGLNLSTGNISIGEKLYYNLFNGSSSEFSENQGTLYTGDAGTNDIIDISIGGVSGNYNWIGNIQEIILYNSDQSSNRSGIETNINDFYSIY